MLDKQTKPKVSEWVFSKYNLAYLPKNHLSKCGIREEKSYNLTIDKQHQKSEAVLCTNNIWCSWKNLKFKLSI